MSHRQQRQYCESVRARFPKHFVNRKVLDVGSMDVNGNNRYLFRGGSYVGCDVAAGKNVDIVGPVWEVPGSFQTIISTEMLEHDPTWALSLQTMMSKLEHGGLLVVTCAGPGRAEHGTFRCPHADMGSTSDYYKNLSPRDLLWAICAFDLRDHEAVYSTANYDTYMFVVKA